MKRSRGLALVAALLASAAMVPTVFAADKFQAAYFDVMHTVGDSWVAGTNTAVLNQAPGVVLTSDAEIRAAVRATLSGLNDRRFRLLSQADLDQLEMQSKAGAISLGAALEQVDVIGSGGVEVSTVADNSFGKASGILSSDKVLLINGHPVVGMRRTDVESMWKDAASGPLNLVIYRSNGGLVTFNVPRTNDGRTGIAYKVNESVMVPKVGAVDPAGPAFEAGLRPGDVIDFIDGIPTRVLPLSTVTSYISAGGPNQSSYSLGVTRAGQVIQLTVQRRIIEGSTEVVAVSKREADNAAQAANPTFAAWVLKVRNLDWTSARVFSTIDQAVADDAHLPGAVLDLRDVQGNNADTAALIAARFISKGDVLKLVKGAGAHQVNVTYTIAEGVLTRVTTGAETHSEKLASNIKTYDGKLAVVVGSNTSKVAAALAQSLQSSGRAKIVGKRTAEDALLVGVVTAKLTDNATLPIELPVARMLRLDGSNMAAVVPDHEASLSEKPFDAFKVIEAATTAAPPAKSP